MNSMMAAGASMLNSMTKEGFFERKYTNLSDATYFRFAKQEGSEQFRYWTSAQKQDFEKILTFYNVMSHSKNVKRGMLLSIDGIRTKQIFFVPMIAKRYTMEESAQYDNLTEEKINQLEPEVLDFSNQDVKYHTSKADFDEMTHVKIRLLYRHAAPINFKTGGISEKVRSQRTIDKAIIHFHGGGFVAMDSASH